MIRTVWIGKRIRNMNGSDSSVDCRYFMVTNGSSFHYLTWSTRLNRDCWAMAEQLRQVMHHESWSVLFSWQIDLKLLMGLWKWWFAWNALHLFSLWIPEPWFNVPGQSCGERLCLRNARWPPHAGAFANWTAEVNYIESEYRSECSANCPIQSSRSEMLCFDCVYLWLWFAANPST